MMLVMTPYGEMHNFTETTRKACLRGWLETHNDDFIKCFSYQMIIEYLEGLLELDFIDLPGGDM